MTENRVPDPRGEPAVSDPAPAARVQDESARLAGVEFAPVPAR